MNKENVLKLINNIIGECEASLKVYKIAQKRTKSKPITSEEMGKVQDICQRCRKHRKAAAR